MYEIKEGLRQLARSLFISGGKVWHSPFRLTRLFVTDISSPTRHNVLINE